MTDLGISKNEAEGKGDGALAKEGITVTVNNSLRKSEVMFRCWAD